MDWERTVVINGEVGEYLTIAREERGTANWFIGSITNETGRQVEVSFDFLEPGRDYRAVIYADGRDAHWDDNPTSIEITEQRVNSQVVSTFQLAPGGGLAISLEPIE